MGQLKPGTQYVYEKADGITYAREFGNTERKVVGMDYDVSQLVKRMDEAIAKQNTQSKINIQKDN